MKKKFIVLLLVLAIVSTSLFAAKGTIGSGLNRNTKERVGIGLTVGYPHVGLGISYTNPEISKEFGFRFVGTLGFGYGSSFHLDASFDWVFAKIQFNNRAYRCTDTLDFGLGAGFVFDAHKGGVGIGPIGTLTVTYNFIRNWTVFIRTHLGAWFHVGGDYAGWNLFYYDVVAGFTYEFDIK